MATTCFVLSAVLITAGTLVAITPLITTWRKHARGRDLVPPLARAWRWVRRVVLRRPPRAVTGGGSAGVITSSGSVSGKVIPAPVGPDAPIEEQVAWLRRHLELVNEDVAELRAGAASAQQRFDDELRAAREESRREIGELRTLTDDIAVGDVRWQLAALVLIGLGSLVGLVPSLFPL